MSTITFTCNNCNQVLRVGAENAGKKAKCSKCGTVLDIPLTSNGQIAAAPNPSPIPPKDDTSSRDDDDRGRNRRDDDLDDRPRRRTRLDDEDDRPRRRTRLEDDEDDRPRRRTRLDDDEDSDRPRRRKRYDDEDEEEDRPRRRKRYDDDEPRGKPWGSWPKVEVGLLLNYIAAIVLAAFAGLMIVSDLFLILGFAARSDGLAKTAVIFGVIAHFVFIALGILIVVGNVFAIFTPHKKGAMVLGIVSLSVVGVGLIFRFIFVMIPLIKTLDLGWEYKISAATMLVPRAGQGIGVGSLIVSIIFMLLIEAEWVLYPLYLRAVSLVVKKSSAAQGSIFTLIIGSSVMGLKLILLIVLYNLAETSETVVYIRFVMFLIANGGILVFALFYMGTISKTRKAVQNRDA